MIKSVLKTTTNINYINIDDEILEIPMVINYGYNHNGHLCCIEYVDPKDNKIIFREIAEVDNNGIYSNSIVYYNNTEFKTIYEFDNSKGVYTSKTIIDKNGNKTIKHLFYDKDNKVIKITSSNIHDKCLPLRLKYDELGRLLSLTNPFGTTLLEYDYNSNIIRVRSSGDVTEYLYSYDNDENITRKEIYNPSVSCIVSTSRMKYDDDGNLLLEEFLNAESDNEEISMSISYEYEKINVKEGQPLSYFDNSYFTSQFLFNIEYSLYTKEKNYVS